MTRNKPSFSNILFRCVALLSVMAMTGCVDDDLGYGPGVYPEGETTVSLEAAFSPFAESELNSRAALPGNAITDISDLVVLVYDKSGNHLSDISPVKIDFSQSEVKYEGRDDHDASNGHKAEAETKCLRDKKITLPYGEYYLIAVANLGTDYSGDPDNMTTGERDTYYELTNPGGKYYNQYGTLDQLRSLKVSWNSDYRLNRQMLGFFTNNTDHSKPDAPKATSEFKTVSIAQPGVSLRAWLRRCASKVTIDFDASGLRENVHVYVKSARIYDAPVECTLGFGNKSGDAEGDYNNHPGKDDDFISPDYTIDYGTGADYTQWPELTKGTPISSTRRCSTPRASPISARNSTRPTNRPSISTRTCRATPPRASSRYPTSWVAACRTRPRRKTACPMAHTSRSRHTITPCLPAISLRAP